MTVALAGDNEPTVNREVKPIVFEDMQKLIHYYARRLQTSARKVGQDIEYDDLYQEVCITWYRCKQEWRTDGGANFTTYFGRAVFYNWNNINKTHVDKTNFKAMPLDSITNLNDNEGYEYHDVVADVGCVNPEENYSRKERLSHLQTITPMFSTFANLIQDEPDELMDELDAAKSQYEYAKSLGVTMADKPPNALTPTSLLRIFNMNWRYRDRLRQEMKEAAEYVSQ